MDATWVWLFRSELAAARPGPGGGGAITGTMPHRPGQDRVSATSSRSRLAATPARRGTPERQVTPGTQDAPAILTPKGPHPCGNHAVVCTAGRATGGADEVGWSRERRCDQALIGDGRL